LSNNNEQVIALTKLPIGQKGVIIGFSLDNGQGENFHKLQITPGEEFQLVRFAPNGDVEINIRGYFVFLPKQDAQHIMVKPVGL
jgi:Fe2+ transport system protein FeoA